MGPSVASVSNQGFLPQGLYTPIHSKPCCGNSFNQYLSRSRPTLGMVSRIINADEKHATPLGCWIPVQFPAHAEDCRWLATFSVSLSPNSKPLLYFLPDDCGTLLYANKLAPMWSESTPLLGPAQAPTDFAQLNYCSRQRYKVWLGWSTTSPCPLGYSHPLLSAATLLQLLWLLPGPL